MSMNIGHFEGTARYRDRINDHTAINHFRLEQNLWLSSIGIGTYLAMRIRKTDHALPGNSNPRGSVGRKRHRIPLRIIVFSAANARLQRPARATGDEGFSRDEIVICTKGGYLPFDGAPREMCRYLERNLRCPGIASLEDIVGGSHCMTPAYLQNQLDQSLGNLGLSCIDVYYIHNPNHSSAPFPRRVLLATAPGVCTLEKMLPAGKIRRYGVATWNGFASLLRPGNIMHLTDGALAVK